MIVDWCANCETTVRIFAFRMSFDDWTKRIWWSIALRTWIKYWLNLSTLRNTDAELIRILSDRSFALSDFNEYFFIDCVLCVSLTSFCQISSYSILFQFTFSWLSVRIRFEFSKTISCLFCYRLSIFQIYLCYVWSFYEFVSVSSCICHFILRHFIYSSIFTSISRREFLLLLQNFVDFSSWLLYLLFLFYYFLSKVHLQTLYYC